MHTCELGTFIVNSGGKIKVDFLYDGGWFQGELDVFRLEDLNPQDFGSEAFIAEVIERVQPSDINEIADLVADNHNWLETT